MTAVTAQIPTFFAALMRGGNQADVSGDGLSLLLAGATIVLAVAWLTARRN